MHAIERPPLAEAFIESLDCARILTKVIGMVIDVQLTKHGVSNDLDEALQAVAVRAEGAPNMPVDPGGLFTQIETLHASTAERLATERNK